MQERLIFHVDVNSAFLSWEAARRVRNGESDLRLIPSAIGGDKNTRTGIILAKSVPAKKYGVTTGEPVGFALKKCPSLVLAKPDFTLYSECSRAFVAICREYAPVLEQFSIDECFLDMTGTGHLYPDPVATANEIRENIRTRLGFTVNIGVGSNKLLAKTASDFEKPDRVHTLFTDEIPEKLWPLPVSDLFAVGKATAEKLRRACLMTVGDCAHADTGYLKRLLGEKGGLMVHDFSNGIDPSPVKETPDEAKCYSISTTMEENIVSYTGAEQILLALTDSVSARMRRNGGFCQSVSVTVRDLDFRTTSHQTTLFNPTDVTAVIAETAKKLLREHWDGKTPLRLIGVSLMRVSRDPLEQLSLFPDEKTEKARRLDKAMDALREKYGSGTVSRGSTMGRPIGRDRK